ncbi:MAG: ABC transporter ATP-binding protein [Dehalococcoidia bacterium]|nr:ABC transporter ATP-binding protein [Dehalococcoidia bacterium]
MLKVTDLYTAYGPIMALRGVSLEVPEGQIVALLGANGAGKSTALRTISGLVHPVRGSIQFMGRSIEKSSPEKIVQLGISQVPEGRQIFFELTVLENLLLGAYVQRSGRAVKQDLEKVFTYFPVLAERRKQAAGTLSGGEQQMVAIGRALMARPRLILLDEPSLGLAPIVVQTIFDIIKTLNQNDGITVLLVEQNAHLALQIAQQGYVLETGRVVLQDTGENLRMNEAVRRSYLGY